MVKKKVWRELTPEHRFKLLEKTNQSLSIRKQCEILDINRNSLYYKARSKSIYNIEIEEIIKYIYFKYPFYGHRKVTKVLKRMNFNVNIKKVQKIRQRLNLNTIYPKPNLSNPKKENKKYPYLLSSMDINRIDMVWATDITYIKIKNKGWIYCVAVLDWHSRYILSFEISNSLDVDFCLMALERALKKSKPDVFNTDQGSQFTSKEFTKILHDNNIKISMDSKDRALDNIRVERFWRSLKYEEVYLTEYENIKDSYNSIFNYIEFYNNERIHQSLNYYTPKEIYFGLENIKIKKW